MHPDTYLVLRVTGVDREAFDLLGAPAERARAEPEWTPGVEYRVETHRLDPPAYRELRRDPQVACLARPMPLRLIRPVAALGPSAEAATAPPATWGVSVTGALRSPYVGYGVAVAVLDTGIDAGHEAFGGVELIQRDFTGEGDGDQHGHGTHVAGTLFGRTVGDVRYGVAPGVRRALIGKVLGTNFSPTTAELVAAVQWAVEGSAHIVNMSLGFDFPGLVKWWVEEEDMPPDLATSRALAQYRDNVRFFDRVVDLLRARAAEFPSALIVAAAGNESRRDIHPDYTIEVAPPAAADGVLAVAALASAGPPHTALSVAPFSNIRAAVAAPGVGIYSAQKGGGYTYLSGTSMASPHAAGVAALWAERQLKHNGRVDVRALDAQLRGNARRDRLPDAGYLDVGEGLVTAPMD
jgi:subtilisin family serine protease